MKITASSTVTAPRERVFAALNDRQLLRRAIPGCEDLTEIDADSFDVKVSLGIAGIKGRYTAHVSRRSLQPPDSFTLAFDGKGTAGFVRGTAAVRITDATGISQVDCDADVTIGGAIAAVGSRLLEAAARKVTQDFFRRLAEEIGAQPEHVAGD